MKGAAYQRADFSEVKKLSRKKAIRGFCCDFFGEVRSGAEGPISCSDPGCPLYRFRSGMSCDEAEKAGYELRGMQGQ